MELNHDHVIAAMYGGGLHLLNTSIVPPGEDGTWVVQTVPNEYACAIARAYSHDGVGPHAHVGHQATADVISLLFNTRIGPDRTPWDGSGCGLALQLRGRIPEGAILSREEMDRIGYDWRVLYRVAEDGLPVSAHRQGARSAADRDQLLPFFRAGARLRFIRRGGTRTERHRYYSVFIGDADVTPLVTGVLNDPLYRLMPSERASGSGGYSGSGRQGRELMVWIEAGDEQAALDNATRQIAAAVGKDPWSLSYMVE